MDVRLRRVLPVLLAGMLVWLGTAGAAHAAADGFTSPTYVDTTLAGGEPLVLADNVHHTIIYSSHEGTTHLYRPGFTSLLGVAFNYRNQVNIWTSIDGGFTWRRTSTTGGFQQNPAQNTGFSDPDLTQDEGGRVYDTGIDLVNDSLFSSNDGGVTFDKGTPNCHDGDRPWLAGGKKDQVFMASDTVEGTLSHQIFESDDGGNTCSSTGVPDAGSTPDGGAYTGYGKLYYNHHLGKLVEPVIYNDKNGTPDGIGVSIWKPGDTTITPTKVATTTLFGHFPIVNFDNADNLYLIWDTNDRQANTSGGCDSAENPLPNHIEMAVSRDFGKTWSAPVTIASPTNARVLWPWGVAGDAGRVSIVWYQTDKLVDPDCEASNVYIYEARVDNAQDPAKRTISITNASGRPVHQNSVCQGGTDCVATGKDRRLGDYFSNAIDPRGCVMIASGDTTEVDPNTGGPMASSLPIFIRQNSGTPLVGNGTCSGATAGNTGHPSCWDTTPPTSTLRLPTGFRRRGRNGLVFRGHSHDVGCRPELGLARTPGRVAGVFISLAHVGRHDCRFVNRKGHLTRRRSCHKPILLRTHGTNRWTFGITVHVPAGNYRAVVRAVDAFGNKEKPSKRRGIIRFRVPRH